MRVYIFVIVRMHSKENRERIYECTHLPSIMRTTVSEGFVSSNGSFPSVIMYSITPRLHTSASREEAKKGNRGGSIMLLGVYRSGDVVLFDLDPLANSPH